MSRSNRPTWWQAIRHHVRGGGTPEWARLARYFREEKPNQPGLAAIAGCGFDAAKGFPRAELEAGEATEALTLRMKEASRPYGHKPSA